MGEYKYIGTEEDSLLFINRKRPPHPDYTNVEAAGAGWYKWKSGKWQRCAVPREYDANARWLSDRKLLDFVVDAAVAARGKKQC